MIRDNIFWVDLFFRFVLLAPFPDDTGGKVTHLCVHNVFCEFISFNCLRSVTTVHGHSIFPPPLSSSFLAVLSPSPLDPPLPS